MSGFNDAVSAFAETQLALQAAGSTINAFWNQDVAGLIEGEQRAIVRCMSQTPSMRAEAYVSLQQPSSVSTLLSDFPPFFCIALLPISSFGIPG